MLNEPDMSGGPVGDRTWPDDEPHSQLPAPALSVSVVLPTVSRWPAVAASLDSLLAQVDAPPFEILLVDGHGEALDGAPVDARVRWIPLPGRDSFELRAEAVARARGAVVAVTEDHCIMPPGWVASIAEAHARDALPSIAGAVSNHPDSAMRAMDRANFMLTFAGQTPGRLSARRRRLPVPTNFSFKVSGKSGRAMDPGDLEYRWIAELQRDHLIGVAESIILYHLQCHGRAVWSIHAASGRSYGASVRTAPFRTRAGWWARLPLVPFRLIPLVVGEIFHQPGARMERVGDALCALALIGSNLYGQVLGALLGPGASREKL